MKRLVLTIPLLTMLVACGGNDGGNRMESMVQESATAVDSFSNRVLSVINASNDTSEPMPIN